MKVGYVRVSTEEQNTARQEVIMRELGVERVFIEKISGKTQRGREELEKMLQFVREGDVVGVESISRIAVTQKTCLISWSGLKKKGLTSYQKKRRLTQRHHRGSSC